MSGTDPFRVLVKQSAVDRNSAVAARVTDPPTVLEFASKTAAQSEAATLTKEGDGPVRVQAVAPQDDTDADAYLVGASRSGTEIPETPPSAGWTFGVDGDQYGALGEALLTAGDGVTRPLESYVRHDLGLGTDRFGVVGEQADGHQPQQADEPRDGEHGRPPPQRADDGVGPRRDDHQADAQARRRERGGGPAAALEPRRQGGVADDVEAGHPDGDHDAERRQQFHVRPRGRRPDQPRDHDGPGHRGDPALAVH
jgi:hypothetical protein